MTLFINASYVCSCNVNPEARAGLDSRCFQDAQKETFQLLSFRFLKLANFDVFQRDHSGYSVLFQARFLSKRHSKNMVILNLKVHLLPSNNPQ